MAGKPQVDIEHCPRCSRPMRGSGLFPHTDPGDRPPAMFGGDGTLLTGGARAS